MNASAAFLPPAASLQVDVVSKVSCPNSTNHTLSLSTRREELYAKWPSPNRCQRAPFIASQSSESCESTNGQTFFRMTYVKTLTAKEAGSK
ncbi:hypothetical protein MRX96_041190 [Rhipicephalus microplus]